jgi:hypothetical protein
VAFGRQVHDRVGRELGKRGIHCGSIADVDLQEAITRGACDWLE